MAAGRERNGRRCSSRQIRQWGLPQRGVGGVGGFRNVAVPGGGFRNGGFINGGFPNYGFHNGGFVNYGWPNYGFNNGGFLNGGWRNFY